MCQVLKAAARPREGAGAVQGGLRGCVVIPGDPSAVETQLPPPALAAGGGPGLGGATRHGRRRGRWSRARPTWLRLHSGRSCRGTPAPPGSRTDIHPVWGGGAGGEGAWGCRQGPVSASATPGLPSHGGAATPLGPVPVLGSPVLSWPAGCSLSLWMQPLGHPCLL